MSRTAVFLDKDGTIIEDVPYCIDTDQMRLTPGTIEGLGRLASVGYQLVVVSNQPGVALGYFPVTALAPVELRLREMLGESGIELAGFYFCPHHPEGRVSMYVKRCECRKPAPGLILNAARELRIELARSWIIGDILNDVEAGCRAGCRTVLIDNGNETEWRLSRSRSPDVLARDLAEAAERIIEQDAKAFQL